MNRSVFNNQDIMFERENGLVYKVQKKKKNKKKNPVRYFGLNVVQQSKSLFFYSHHTFTIPQE